LRVPVFSLNPSSIAVNFQKCDIIIIIILDKSTFLCHTIGVIQEDRYILRNA